ncbi:MAG: transposase [Candidatus Eisenbacteria bacterium]|nr:transposase [Candidatus Eisenbacteria bacterium]
MQDILIARGRPEGLSERWGGVRVQLCIVHMVRNSLRYVSWRERKAVAQDLQEIYLRYRSGRGARLRGQVGQSVPFDRRDLAELGSDHPVLQLPGADSQGDLRQCDQSLNSSMRKVTKKRGAFPNGDSVRKVLYLARDTPRPGGVARSKTGPRRSITSPSCSPVGSEAPTAGTTDDAGNR